MEKNLVVAMAHANDMEHYCGGTVAKFAQAGYRVILLMLSANISGADLHGDGNYLKHLPEEVAPVREAEAHAGAEILGVDTITQVGFKDFIYYNGKNVAFLGDPGYNIAHPSGSEPLIAAAGNVRCIERVKKLLQKYEPEIVITHNFSSGLEHTCAAHLMNHAFGQAVHEGAKLGSLWIPTHVRHSAWESDVRLFPSPNVLIDVTNFWTLKIKAIRAHKSQKPESAINKMELIGRYWGIARQCRYAEPFFMINDTRYR